MTIRVAIIGAGPCGMAQLRAFQSARDKGAKIPELVCYEKQKDWGGMWNYTWRTGLDEHGEAVHGSMYRYLWSNGPKECLEFADYTFEEHFGHPIASFPPREVLWDYIKGRVEKAGVRDYIRFENVVRNVTFNAQNHRFTVVAQDHGTNTQTSEEFDYVINACGHFSTPTMPYFQGFEHFGGRVLHAHDFRDALEFKGKDLLLIGSSYSAEDIGSQCYKYGARSITSCYRTAPMDYAWPENWEEKPLLQRLDKNRAYFIDGTHKHIDAVILCTGYQHHFPFLSDDLCLKTDNRLWPMNLYKGIFWESNPQMLYLGMQDQWYSFNMFDAQAWYARDVILQRIALPDHAHMVADSKQWQARELALETVPQMFEFQGSYIQQLVDATDYPNFDIAGVNDTFLTWKHDKAENIMGYRDKSHRSLMTGTQSPPHHTPWLEALDDSMAAYLGDVPTDIKSVG